VTRSGVKRTMTECRWDVCPPGSSLHDSVVLASLEAKPSWSLELCLFSGLRRWPGMGLANPSLGGKSFPVVGVEEEEEAQLAPRRRRATSNKRRNIPRVACYLCA
jgi:hypothetical protein